MGVSFVLLASLALGLPQREFCRYYKEITGQDPQPEIVSVAIDPKVSHRGNDAYQVKSTAHGVRIVGSNVRSLFYGVYDILERRGGCRWFWDGDSVPHRTSIDLSGLNIEEEAHFHYRGLRYFAHRGLTRFQAEHWGPEDWKREIDWCLKKRLNLFMPRIGMDDTWQKAYPEIVPYPDARAPAKMQGYNNRISYWGLRYRGELRRGFTQYALDRGLLIPTDFGTMSHWYSRTPDEFLEKMKPPFLPHAKKTWSNHTEPSGSVWDVFQPGWLDRYWHLTEAFIAAGYGTGELLHTVGLGERHCFDDRERNLRMKIDVLKMLEKKGLQEYSDAKILLAGWDFYCSWKPQEVARMLDEMDSKSTIVWDYEADAEPGRDRWQPKLNNDFTQWNLVGRFPYTFGIFLAYESGLDIRARYDIIEARERVVTNDPFCKGYILWPEASHTDTFLLRYFTANAWRPGQRHDELLPRFCKDRYGEDGSAFASVWSKVIPISQMLGWGGNWCADLMKGGDQYLPCRSLEDDEALLGGVDHVFSELAAIDPQGEFKRRDIVDLARTVADRMLIVNRHRLLRAFGDWRAGLCPAEKVRKLLDRELALAYGMRDVLALHTDYSICESFDRLMSVRRTDVPDFEKVLFDNTSCSYCRSHQYELTAGWYVPFVEDLVNEYRRKLDVGERVPVDRRQMAELRDERYRQVREIGIGAWRPRVKRDAESYRRTLTALAECCK